MSMKSLVEALNLRSLILQNFELALNKTDLKDQESLMSFVIVGGGPTGVELAGALAELKKHILPHDYPDLDIRKMQIHIIESAPRLLAAMSQKASNRSANFLKKMGVNIWLNTQVEDYDGYKIKTSKKTFYANTLIWAAGVCGTPVGGLNTATIIRGNRLQACLF